MPRCPHCATGERPLMLGSRSGWVQAFHGVTSEDAQFFLIAAVCDEWNRFVDTDPEGTGR